MVESTRIAYSSLSFAALSMRMPSRSHCTAEPATNTLPSSAYCAGPPSALQAIVVSRPCAEAIARVPVFISMKQPVPYVFLAMPGSKQACPNSAACWSPATPRIGMRQPKKCASFVSPKLPEDGRASGSIASGTPRMPSSSGSQRSSWMLNSSVREAFV